MSQGGHSLAPPSRARTGVHGAQLRCCQSALLFVQTFKINGSSFMSKGEALLFIVQNAATMSI